MSITVATRVWKNSRQRGTMKLLLLALAEFANNDGVCWPSVGKLANYINETERNTRLLIRRLINEGELVTVPGGGRGNTTRYGIAIGLTQRQLTQLNSDLQNTVYRNTDTDENSVENNTETEINSEILCTETVKSGAGDEVPNSAPESAETAQNQNDNRNRTVSKNHRGGYKDQSSPPPFFEKLAEVCNINLKLAPANQRSQLGEAAAKLSSTGATVEQLDAFAVWWWSDSNWRTKKALVAKRKPEAPRPQEVLGEWGNAVLPAPLNGHRQAGRGPPEPVKSAIPAGTPSTDTTARKLVELMNEQRKKPTGQH